jgi:hypothetical protein
MTDNEIPTGPRPASLSGAAEDDSEGPSFSDAIRFLHGRRVGLTARFILSLGLGLIGFLLWFLLGRQVVGGRIILTFEGIERGEYPSGKTFSVEDLRGAEILHAAANDAGLPRDIDLNRLSANIEIIPIIPAEVLARWRKQDRDGQRREEFVPNQFEMRIRTEPALSGKGIRLFDAIVKRYRARVKFDEKAALRFLSDISAANYDDLVKIYDYWEIPYVLDQNVDLLRRYLTQLIKESRDYKDPHSNYSFRSLATELDVWSAIRLEALKALTSKGRLVRDKDVALLTMQYRIESYDIQVRQTAQEAADALRLVEAVQKPQTLAVTQSAGTNSIPIVDNAVIDRLMRSDYLAAGSAHFDLQERTMKLQAEKARLEKDIGYLGQARNLTPKDLPASHREIITASSSELSAIVRRYNAVLDSYLNDVLANAVLVREGPRLIRGGSPVVALAAIVIVSALLALLAVMSEHLIRKALAGVR